MNNILKYSVIERSGARARGINNNKIIKKMLR